MKIGIKNGHITDPVTGRDETADVLIEGNRIRRVERDCDLSEADRVIDAAGWIVAPGLMDAHVHFRDPGLTYKEDIRTGAAAAKRGGFTTVLCMANSSPTVSTPEILRRNLEAGRQTGIHVLQAATVTVDMKGETLTEMDELAAAGAAAFTDDGIPITDGALLAQAMEKAKALNLPICLHEEDPAFVSTPGVNRGRVSRRLGLGGAAALAEESLLARDSMIALATGADVIFQHLSSGNSVKMVRAAKALGAPVYAEATPHHFTLTEEAVLSYGTNAKMNPPLRTEKDRQEILRGLQDGTIDTIATDHAPHADWEKALPFAQAPSGITGLETSLALGVTVLVRGGILSMMELMEKMSRRPREICRQAPQGIEPGAPADLVLFAPEEKFTVGDFASKASNSPFQGWELYGPVHFTLCDGAIVYES